MELNIPFTAVCAVNSIESFSGEPLVGCPRKIKIREKIPPKEYEASTTTIVDVWKETLYIRVYGKVTVDNNYGDQRETILVRLRFADAREGKKFLLRFEDRNRQYVPEPEYMALARLWKRANDEGGMEFYYGRGGRESVFRP